mgnify:CR=1 FL=1
MDVELRPRLRGVFHQWAFFAAVVAGGVLAAVAIWVVLNATVVLAPVAVWLAVRWSLLAPVAELEERTGHGTLRRSAELVRGRWLRVASLVGVGAVLALAAGPLLGALLIIATDAPLALLNVVAGIVYALAMPFVALTTAYVYFDARARYELEPELLAGQRPPAPRVGENEVERGARVGRARRRRRRHSRKQLLRHGSVPKHLDLPAAAAVEAEVALPLGERT